MGKERKGRETEERERERGGGEREREVAAQQQEDINSVNAVIRANLKYRASIKHGTKIIICIPAV